MAHFKRKRARVCGRHTRSDKTRFTWPNYWDILWHRRPHRRATKRIEHAILSGKLDPDNAAWPVSKRPHQYYW